MTARSDIATPPTVWKEAGVAGHLCCIYRIYFEVRFVVA